MLFPKTLQYPIFKYYAYTHTPLHSYVPMLIRLCLRLYTHSYAYTYHNNINIVAILTFAVVAKKNM